MPSGIPMGMPFGLPGLPGPPQKPDATQAEVPCQQCGTKHKIYAKFAPKPQIDKDLQRQGFTAFPKDGKLKCKCGFVMDLSALKNQMEMLSGKKIIT